MKLTKCLLTLLVSSLEMIIFFMAKVLRWIMSGTSSEFMNVLTSTLGLTQAQACIKEWWQ